MSHEIILKRTYVNPISGKTTWQLGGEVYLLDEWLKENVHPDGIENARSHRTNKMGFHTFKSGCGYDIVDADLLGGNGSGLNHRLANDAGFHFTRR